MYRFKPYVRSILLYIAVTSLCSCASYAYNRDDNHSHRHQRYEETNANYADRLPQHIASSEKTVVVDPHVHAWGAYSGGSLVHAGEMSAGSGYCRDLGRPCRTKVGTFRINSLGSPHCKSSIFPLPHGGAPMPYCMFFNKNQALHGSYEVAEANISHGCVRLRVPDAEWLRYNFANVGTRVVVKPY